MKKLIFFLLFMPAFAAAQGNLTTFVSEAIHHAEGDSAFNLHGEKFGALYVPLRTIDLPVQNAFDVGGGAVFGAGKPEGLISARLNIPQLLNGLFGTSWFQKYSHGQVLPTVFIGPALKMEFPTTNWTWKKDTFLIVGIPFGGL